MPSKDSSTDDTCRCGHERQDHALTYDPARRRCTVTAGGARCGCAAFWLDTPREEGAGESGGCETCKGMLAGWCRDCGRRVPDGGHVHEWGEWTPFALGRVRIARRTCPCGATDSRPGRFCAHCEGPHATEDCKALLEEDEAGSCVGCGHAADEHRAGLEAPYNRCNWCAECSGVEEPEGDVEGHQCDNCDGYDPSTCAFNRPAPPEPRPPYAVAYSVGGRLYETYLPGDATATAVDGMLQITHDEPVLAIVSVKPIKEGA